MGIVGALFGSLIFIGFAYLVGNQGSIAEEMGFWREYAFYQFHILPTAIIIYPFAYIFFLRRKALVKVFFINCGGLTLGGCLGVVISNSGLGMVMGIIGFGYSTIYCYIKLPNIRE